MVHFNILIKLVINIYMTSILHKINIVWEDNYKIKEIIDLIY